MKKKFTVILTAFAATLALLIAVPLAGCTADDEPVAEEYGVTPVYASAEYILHGDETIPALVTLKDYKLFCAQGEQYKQLVDSVLRTVPESLTGADTMITDRIQFNDIYFEAGKDGEVGTVYVDFKGEAAGTDEILELSGGSLEETIIISQIVESLVHSFDEVEQVQFLINGQNTETLMGHCDVTEPFTEGIYTIE